MPCSKLEVHLITAKVFKEVLSQVVEIINLNIDRNTEWAKSLDSKETKLKSKKFELQALTLEQLKYEIVNKLITRKGN